MNKIIINTDIKVGNVKRDFYGSFSEHLGRCIYEGVYVGIDSEIPNVNGMRSDVVKLLKDIGIPLLRWPGGCFADEYFWKDGIGPKSNRKSTYNSHWGGIVENNHFGTHEFFELCEQIGCDAYVNLNVGSGTIQDMKEWVEYMTMPGSSPMANLRRENGRDKPFNVKYLGIGNENWGCGGNMCADYYANLFNRYSTFVKQYGEERPYKVAGGANVDDYNWTEVMMKRSKQHFDGVSVHYYTIPGDEWEHKGDATCFSEKEWYTTLKKAYDFDEMIRIHSAVMDRYDPQRKKGLIIDEWGTWFDVSKGTNPGFLEQESTMRDALVAALHFNMFHKYSERIEMCTIAQTVNVLQSLIMTKDEKAKLTPTYYVFKMYKDHIDNDIVSCHSMVEKFNLDGKLYNLIDTTATVSKEKEVIVSTSNLDMTIAKDVELDIRGLAIDKVEAQILTADSEEQINTFEQENISTKKFENYKIVDNKICFCIPKHSILTFTIN